MGQNFENTIISADQWEWTPSRNTWDNVQFPKHTKKVTISECKAPCSTIFQQCEMYIKTKIRILMGAINWET